MREMLLAIGYWRERQNCLRWPHPSELVDASVKASDELVHYLNSGFRLNDQLGYSTCRFNDGPSDEKMGSCDLTDGTWVWPEGLSVYVRNYSVKLPDRFTNHVFANNFQHPKLANYHKNTLEGIQYDFEFWNTWCQKNRSNRVLALLSKFDRDKNY